MDKRSRTVEQSRVIDAEQSVGYMQRHIEVLKPYNVTSLIDIGANRGQFSFMWNNVFQSDDITMIEANSKIDVSDLPWKHIIQALGKEGKAKLYINPAEIEGGGTSLYKEATEWFDAPIVEEVDVVTLDSLNLSADMVKMDVQGAELDVLKGGVETLENCRFLLLELAFIPYNEDAPLIDDVLAETRKQGFKMIDTFGPHHGGHYYSGKKCQVDVLFAKEDSDYFEVV